MVVTHWDDDHIRGMSRLVAEAQPSTLVCSAALGRKELLSYVFEQDVGGTVGFGVDEIRKTLRAAKDYGARIVFAQELQELYPVPPGAGPQVRALSPSPDAVERALVALAEAIADERSDLRRRFKAPEGPNGASVVTEVELSGTSVLLGADLENSGNPATGWDAVLTNAKPASPASAIKVPHHASAGAHHPRVWEEMLEDDPTTILTPWALGGGTLPLPADLDRLKGLTKRLYVTARPRFRRAKQEAGIDKLVRRLHGERLQALEGWGHVRSRRRPNEDEWRTELGGDAFAY